MNARRFRRASLPAAAAALALALPAAAAGDTLLEAMAKAYVANPQLEAERARLRAADEGVPQALSGWRADGNGQRQRRLWPVQHQETVGFPPFCSSSLERKHRIS